MAFDLSTAKPEERQGPAMPGFDLATAKPVTKEAEKGSWGHKAKLLGSDLVKGALSLPALLADIIQMPTNESGDRDPRDPLYNPDYFPVTGMIQRQGAQPETQAEKWQSAITQGGAGGLANPAGLAKPIQATVAGMTSGAGAETAASLLGEGPLQRLLGGLAGGIGGAATASRIGRAAPQIEELAAQALKGISPEMLTKAQAYQAQAAQSGVTLDLAQALEATGAPASNITTLRNVLANSQHGSKVQALERAQPDELLRLADTTVAGLPGKVRQADVASNNMQQSATDRLTQAREARTAATRPFYEAAGNLPTYFRTEMANTLSEALARPGISSDAAGKLREALGSLKAAPGTGAAMTHAADYDNLIRELAGPFQGQPMSGAGSAFIGDVVPKLKSLLREASPETRQGAALHAQISQEVVDPLKKSLIGTFATKRGALPDTMAQETKLQQLYNKGEDPTATGKSNIYQLGMEMGKVRDGAESFVDGLKTYISGKVGKAAPAELPNNPATDVDFIRKVSQGLFADRAQYNGLRQGAAASAKLMGLPEADVVRGLDNFAGITKALLNRPDTVGGLSRKEVFNISGKNYGSDALRMFGIAPLAGPARRIEDFFNRRTFEHFDQLLTTPEGAAKLAELGKVPVMSQAALTIYSTLGGTTPQVSAGANAPGITNH
jgi:hypothetical protein